MGSGEPKAQQDAAGCSESESNQDEEGVVAGDCEEKMPELYNNHLSCHVHYVILGST